MRQDIDIRVGVDVGSHAVRAVVLRPAKGANALEDGLLGPVEILGAGVAESRGVVSGEVYDARQASRAIREAVEEAERASGVAITRAVLGASGGRVGTRGVDARVGLSDGRVEPWDPEQARSALRRAAREPGRQRLLEQIASFRVKGAGQASSASSDPIETTDPVGLPGKCLLASAVMLEADAIPLAALAAAGRRAGVETRALGWSPLAAALALLGEKEREDGAALVDLGARSTGLVLFSGGRLLYASGRRSCEDGDGLWRWLRETLGGFLGPDMLPQDLLPAGLVLSGGGALRPDALSLARAETGLEARVASLGGVQGLPGPAAEWAAAIGLARLLEATDRLRRRTDTTRVPTGLHRPVAAQFEAAGGAEALLPELRSRGGLLETGIDILDEHPARPALGQLCLLASEPFSGASALALQIALHSALHRLEPTLLLTCDQGFKRTVLELAGIESQVDPIDLLHGSSGRRRSRQRHSRQRPSKVERLAGALVRLSDAPLWVLDSTEDGVDDLCSLLGAVRDIQEELTRGSGGRSLGLKLVVIDPVAALGPTHGWNGYMLRDLARELSAVVLAVATTACLRDSGPNSERPEPHRLEDIGRVGDLGDAADVLWLAQRPGMLGEDGGDELTLRMATRPFGASGSCVLRFDGQRLAGWGRGEPPREPGDLLAERARKVLVACEPFMEGWEVLLRRYPLGATEQELLAGGELEDWLREYIQDSLGRGYGGFLLDRAMVVRRGGRLVPVDLGRMDTLFGPPAGEAARVLFELGPGDQALREDGFDWAALARLLAGSVRRAMSWGDGHLSDGAWLVAAPRPSGVLSLSFDFTRGRAVAEPPGDPLRLLRPDGYVQGTLERGPESSVRVLPSGARLDPVKLEGVLAVLGASPGELGGIRVLCRGPADPVLFELGGVVRSALMPMRAQG